METFLFALQNHYTNDQYHELVDSQNLVYETRNENSIFFEVSLILLWQSWQINGAREGWEGRGDKGRSTVGKEYLTCWCSCTPRSSDPFPVASQICCCCCCCCCCYFEQFARLNSKNHVSVNLHCQIRNPRFYILFLAKELLNKNHTMSISVL